MAVNKPSNASCRDVADEADDNATPVDGLNKGASDLPLAISGTGCDTEGAEVLEHDASSTPATTTIFRRFGSVDHRKLGSPPRHGMPSTRHPTEQIPNATTHFKAKQLDVNKAKTRPVRAPQP